MNLQNVVEENVFEDYFVVDNDLYILGTVDTDPVPVKEQCLFVHAVLHLYKHILIIF